jgi:two-component system, NarL family, response regulator DevR
MRVRVLLVDDFPLVRHGIGAALESDPAIEVVGHGSNAHEGVERALELRPDVVVLDMRMPDSSGVAVIEQLREKLPEARVLVVTASERSETLLEAIGAGAAGFLTKRASLQELCQAVISVYSGGSVLPPELASQALREYATAGNGDGIEARPLLTAREREMLRLVADGLTDKQIAEQLFVSPRTVQSHLARIRQKVGVTRRSALARWAAENLA